MSLITISEADVVNRFFIARRRYAQLASLAEHRNLLPLELVQYSSAAGEIEVLQRSVIEINSRTLGVAANNEKG